MTERQPTLRPTDAATIVIVGLGTAAVAWILINTAYEDLPRMIWPPVLLIAGLGAFEAVLAWQVRRRVPRPGRPREPGQEPLDPLFVARLAVLAKASSVGASIFLGLYAGFLPWLAIESARLTSAADDLPATFGGAVASAVLLAAALWLERSCRVPEEDGQEGEDPARGDRGGPG